MSDGIVKIDTKLDESGIDKGQKSINQKLSGLKGTASGITSSMASVAGAAFAAMGVAGATAFVKMGIESAATAAAVEAQWNQVFTGMEGPAAESLNALSEQFGILPERLKPSMTAFQSYFKSSGMGAEEAMSATNNAMTLAADGAAFYDKSLEETSASLKSFMMGNYEAGDAIGINTNATKVAKSYNEKYGGSFDDLNDAQKQNYLLEYANGIYEASGAMGQGARESESYSNVLGNLKQAWQNFLAIIGKPFMAVAIKGMQLLSGWLVIAGNSVQMAYDKFSAFFASIKNGEGFFGGLVTAVTNMVGAVKGAFSEGNFEGAGAIAGKIIPLIINSLMGGIPRLLQMGAQLLNKLSEGMGVSIPKMMEIAIEVITSFITSFISALPMIIDTGMQVLQGLIKGIMNAIPFVISTIQTVLETLTTAIMANLPLLLEAGVNILNSLLTGILQTLPWLIVTFQMLFQNIVTLIMENLPMLLQMGITILTELINGIVGMIPALIPMVMVIIMTVVDAIISNLPMIIDAGIQILNSLVDGIINMLPALLDMALTLIMALFNALIDNLPTILNAGVELLLALVDGVLSMLPELGAAALEIVSAVWDVITETDWLSIGSDIIAGIASGISSAGSALWDAAKGILGSFEQNVKDFFGIKSPSRLMRDQVGKYIPQGIAVGMEDEEDTLLKASTSMSATVMAGLKGIKQPNIARVASAAYGSGSVTNTTTKTNTITQNVYVNESLSERELQKRLRIEAQKLGYGVI